MNKLAITIISTAICVVMMTGCCVLGAMSGNDRAVPCEPEQGK